MSILIKCVIEPNGKFTVKDLTKLPDTEIDTAKLANTYHLMTRLCQNVKKNHNQIEAIKNKLVPIFSNASLIYRIRCLDILSQPFAKDPSLYEKFLNLQDSMLMAAANSDMQGLQDSYQFQLSVIRTLWTEILSGKKTCCMIEFKKNFTATLQILHENKTHLQLNKYDPVICLKTFILFLYNYSLHLERFDICSYLLIEHKEQILIAIETLGDKSLQTGAPLSLEKSIAFFNYASEKLNEYKNSFKNTYLFITSLELLLVCLLKDTINSIDKKQEILYQLQEITDDLSSSFSKNIFENYLEIIKIRLVNDFKISITDAPQTLDNNYSALSEDFENSLKEIRANYGILSWNWVISHICGQLKLWECDFLDKNLPTAVFQTVVPFIIQDLNNNITNSSKFLFSLYSIPYIFFAAPELIQYFIEYYPKADKDSKLSFIFCMRLKMTLRAQPVLKKFLDEIEVYDILFQIQNQWKDAHIINSDDFNILNDIFENSHFEKLNLYYPIPFLLDLLILGLGKKFLQDYIKQIIKCLSIMKNEGSILYVKNYNALLEIIEQQDVTNEELVTQIESLIIEIQTNTRNMQVNKLLEEERLFSSLFTLDSLTSSNKPSNFDIGID